LINRLVQENEMPNDPRTEEPSAAAAAATALRYCCQPIQPPRQFDAAVDPQRVRAIVAGGKKWVNGTPLSFHCYQAGDAVASAWCGSATDIAEVRQAFQAWFNLGIGISFKEVARPEEAKIRIAFDRSGGSCLTSGGTILPSATRGNDDELWLGTRYPLRTRYRHARNRPRPGTGA
jgi:hypothetical protein